MVGSLVIPDFCLNLITFDISHSFTAIFLCGTLSSKSNSEEIIMPNVNPRTNLTLKPELHDLIQETADHLGLKRAQLITNLLEEFAPQLEKMCIAFREIKEKQVDPSLVVSAFGADSMAEITQATAQLAQELAQMQKGKKHD